MSSEAIYNGGNMPRFSPLAGDAECDVLIIGGGLCGLLCAHYLQSVGVNVLICEAERIASAVTARSTAVVTVGQDVLCRDLERRRGIDTARGVMRARLEALSEYRALCRELGCRSEVCDFYLYSKNGAAELEREYGQLRRLGINASLVRDMPLRVKLSAAIRFSGQLQLDPTDFCARIARGLNIRENTRVTRLTKYGAETDKYSISARSVIVATHFPLPKFRGLYSLKLYQKRSYVLALEGSGGIGGAYEDIAEDGMYMRMYGKYLLLGGGDHRTGCRGGFEPLLQYRADNFAHTNIRSGWATQDTVSLDGLPYIGRLTRFSDKFYVASGFGGYGFIGSMISAMLLRDLLLDRQNDAAKIFDPSRSMLSAQLFQNIFTSLGNYLRPTARRCPHLGCALVWNPDERTWDCPCHGSRFDKSGKLLNDPAQHDLKRRNE